MTMEESVHYSIDEPEAEDEWLWTGPAGDHHARLGDDYRAFTVSMFHELHCTRVMRRLVYASPGKWRELTPAQQGHIHHCFVYLRLWSLCAADTTLEPGDFAHRNFTTERTGATHVCKDWDPVYDFIEDGWGKWTAARTELGLPQPEY